MTNDSRPIGVFDSGIGGLTVLRELIHQFPTENFIYLGDTARLPYGSKSAQTVRKYCDQNMIFLKSRNVKALIVACNTASTQISESFFQSLPVYNVIDPGAEFAVRTTQNKKVAVLGTYATVKANTYQNRIQLLDSTIDVESMACPLFVPLAEEGWYDDPITLQIAERYLSKLQMKDFDTLILACTHYPLLKKSLEKSFKKLFQSPIQFVDSGKAICNQLLFDFQSLKLTQNTEKNLDSLQICLTDFSPQFESLSQLLISQISTRPITFETVSVI